MIKRVNPFMIAGVLAVILIVLLISIYNIKSSINQENIDLANYELKAKNIKSLKKIWNQKKVESKLKSIVSSPTFQGKAEVKKVRKNILLEIKDADKRQIDMVAKNLLNEPFNIKKLSIKRVDDKKAYFSAEVAQ